MRSVYEIVPIRRSPLWTSGLALLVLLTVSCRVDFNRRVAEPCGNDAIDPAEQCDGTDLDGESCESLGFYAGTLTCSDSCRFVLDTCEATGYCGDGLLQSSQEACDGSVSADSTCATLGLGVGELSCTTDCLLDTSGCEGICGDGMLQTDLGEVCDGFELGGTNCASLGYLSGDVTCTADCTDFDTTTCAPLPTGAPCDTPLQCAGGICFSEVDDGWPDGTCTRDCESDPCVAPAECLEHTNGERRCYDPCVDHLDCRPGYGCFDRWAVGTSFCYPHCDADADCPDTGDCNPYSRICGTPETGAAYGTPCVDGSECLGSTCISSWPGGSCTSFCSLTDGECPTGTNTVCVDISGGGMGDLGACMPTCTVNNDCPRSGYSCSDLYLSPTDICAPN